MNSREEEYIRYAALRGVDDKGSEVILTGRCHANLYGEAIRREMKGDGFNHREEGFVTSEGRFVSRGEAHEIAFKRAGYLESWQLEDDPRYCK